MDYSHQDLRQDGNLPQHKRPKQTKWQYIVASYRRWLYRHSDGGKPRVRVALMVLGIFVVLNGLVFAVQHGRMPVLAKLNGNGSGLKSVGSVKEKLAKEHASRELNIEANKNVSFKAVDVGIALDSEKTFAVLTHKTGWERIPIVSFFADLFIDIKPVYKIDQKVLASKLDPLITGVDVPVKNAEALIPANLDAPVTITKESEGKVLNAAVAAEEVTEQVNKQNFSAKITVRVIKPIRTQADVEGFMKSIQAARQRSIALEQDGKKIEINRLTLVPMLRVGGKTGELVMTLDPALLTTYLSKQTDPYYVGATPTKVSKKDGVETSGSEGVPGKKIDSSTSAKQLATAFEQNKTTTSPVLAVIDPEVKTADTYTETDSALHKVIEDFDKSHDGSYYVAAVELKSPSTHSAFYNADTSIITASTYKVFLAYGILQRIEAGTLTKNSSTSAGTVGYCMQRAMIVSDNTCASALQTVLGWVAFDTKLKADGFKATTLNNYSTGDKLSTARDEMAVLTRIYNHELVNKDSADYLFGLMKQQIYTEGIVAGSRGAPVAAKVGFLDDYYHDVGIVYSPKATYALVIMSKGGGGFGNVKLLAQQVYDYYNK